VGNIMTKKQNSKKSTNPFIAILAVIAYIIAGLTFYSLFGGGIVMVIAAFFNRDHLLSFLLTGLAFLVVSLGVNLVVMRITTGKWKIHWPEIWPFGMY